MKKNFEGQQYRGTSRRDHEERYQRTQSNSNLSSSPGHWKRFVQHEGLMERNNQMDRENSYHEVSRLGSPTRASQNEPTRYQPSNYNKKREDMMRRVKQIQDKVMPILRHENRKGGEADEDFGWQNRMEERISKLQIGLDQIEKSMQIQLQKRLLEVEKKWQHKFDDLFNSRMSRESNGDGESQRRYTSENISQTD